MLVTCSVDKTVTLWDTQNVQINEAPRPCGSKDMQVGKLYTVNFYPSAPWLLGCAGSGKELALWDMSCEAAVQNRFGSRVVGERTMNDDGPKDEEAKKEDFDSMMAAGSSPKEETGETVMDRDLNKKKKDRNKKKKQVHRKS
jgi:hypothetical protein